jgi:hypothetical protein
MKYALLLLLMPVCTLAMAQEPDLVDHYNQLSMQMFPEFAIHMPTIKNKVYLYAFSKNKLQDEEYIKILFSHYLILAEIDITLLNEAQ